MISYDTAVKLKEAGLEWEPKVGDFYCHLNDPARMIVEAVSNGEGAKKQAEENGAVWLPTLSQLLAEIEKRGYWPNLRKISELFIIKYELSIHKTGEQRCEKRFTFHEVGGETWEESAALALLWILESEKL